MTTHAADTQISTSGSTSQKTLKDTLNLPQTQFSMRANAAQREPEFQQQWDAAKVYAQAQERRQGKTCYTLHDGPLYLSAPTINIGHALNKILKDFVTRYQYQRGFA